MHTFEFLVFDGFSNMVLASALEPLRDVKMRAQGAKLNWVVSTLDGQELRSSSGLRIAPDTKFDAAQSGRTLILLSGYFFRDQITVDLEKKLRQVARHNDPIIAMDGAAWMLASAGLLDGKAATIHWQEFADFQEAFPAVKVSTARFTRAGQFICCGGASTALEMILELIKERFGTAAAFDASNMFLYDPARQNEFGRGAQVLRRTGPPKVLNALNVMAEHIEDPLSTFELAAQVGVSECGLNRAFQRELGLSVGKYYRLFRLQKARDLVLGTGLSQEQIALRCGYASGASLARAFRAEFAVSLRDLRAPA
ncbi:AraC family transcriptional regulator [Amylibacter marinus]|uniref:AraC family transcriptional regulator n=1 Tax=Amylibacter marinus TaxID=1475483 RepID=A0ABQ5VXV5_9RHOB|nr:helix-turn-helix domain-containing protein [Amylibacter marinus]GLQ36108.1 AraC family transcriptional regulator [Amylibacter marinus]